MGGRAEDTTRPSARASAGGEVTCVRSGQRTPFDPRPNFLNEAPHPTRGFAGTWRAVKETGSPARTIRPMFRRPCVAIDVSGMHSSAAAEPEVQGVR